MNEMIMRSAVQTHFQIRRATSCDIEELVNLHYRVFDISTHHLLLMGRPLMVRAYGWYCGSPNAFAMVAQDGQAILGCTTVNQGSYYSFFRENWVQVARALISKPQLIFHPLVVRRLRAFRGQTRVIPQKTHSAYLAYMAVDPRTRGKNVGTALIRATIETCGARGWDQVLTSFHRANAAAYSFYKALGFEPFPELDTDDLVGVRINTACYLQSRRVGPVPPQEDKSPACLPPGVPGYSPE